MAEKVELVNGFAVTIEGDGSPVLATRDNIAVLWTRMSAEQKAHHGLHNVRVSEMSPELEAHEKEQLRDKSLDKPLGKTDATTGQPVKPPRRSSGGEG